MAWLIGYRAAERIYGCDFRPSLFILCVGLGKVGANGQPDALPGASNALKAWVSATHLEIRSPH